MAAVDLRCLQQSDCHEQETGSVLCFAVVKSSGFIFRKGDCHADGNEVVKMRGYQRCTSAYVQHELLTSSRTVFTVACRSSNSAFLTSTSSITYASIKQGRWHRLPLNTGAKPAMWVSGLNSEEAVQSACDHAHRPSKCPAGKQTSRPLHPKSTHSTARHEPCCKCRTAAGSILVNSPASSHKRLGSVHHWSPTLMASSSMFFTSASSLARSPSTLAFSFSAGRAP